MWTENSNENKQPTDYKYRTATVNLSDKTIQIEDKNCETIDEFLGGIGRLFKILSKYDVSNAFDPSAPLVMELGCFSGTNVMTGLRTFFGV